MTEISLITFNVSADFTNPPNVPSWDERKGLSLQALQRAKPDIIGLQEAMPGQIAYFQANLPDFEGLTVEVTSTDEALLDPIRRHYGLDTLPSPHEVVLFVRRSVFEVVDRGHWWLSPTPDQVSVGFGNIAPRLVLWGQLRHRVTARELIVFNSHLDWRCAEAMVAVCLTQMASFLDKGLPLIFMGDFNIEPAHEAYTRLVVAGWQDSYTTFLAPDVAIATETFQDRGRIDHLFYRGPGLIPLAWETIPSPDPQRRLSDHTPVYGRFQITTIQQAGTKQQFQR